MDFKLILFTFFVAFLVAKLEINIEGKHGWAEKLPTHKIKNKFTQLFLHDTPLTGYHVWLLTTIFFFFHLPFFMGTPWSISSELNILGSLFLFWIIEDFLWFVLNPAFGISKFTPKHVTWHKKWIGFLPKNYIFGILISIGLFLGATFAY